MHLTRMTFVTESQCKVQLASNNGVSTSKLLGASRHVPLFQRLFNMI